MQKTTIKTKLLPALFTLCMVLALVPISAFAADLTVSNETELTAAAPCPSRSCGMLRQ